MGNVIKYDFPNFWSVTLTTVRRDSVQWTHRAEMGDVGMSEFTLEDPDGTAGHASDSLVGHKTIRVNETSAHPSNSNILTGYVGDRRYVRNAEAGLLTGPAKDIIVTVPDINAAANFEIFHDGDGDRPAETVTQRITWLLGSFYIQAFDLGLVETSSVAMDANNYDGQFPADVLTDCAIKAGFNWWLYWDPAAGGTALGFLDANTSTLYSSTLRISNVDADVDSGVDEGVGATDTYFPYRDAELSRSPLHTYSGVYLTWDGGATYRRNTATGSNFAWRDGPAPTASVKTAAAALALADKELEFASTETDGLTVSIVVRATEVNEVRAGQRLQVKFTHLPGYEDWRWCRILTKTVRQEARDDVYFIDLVLSPQCPALGVLQVIGLENGGDADKLYFPASFTAAMTAGSLLMAHIGYRNTASVPSTPNTAQGYTLVRKQETINGVNACHALWAIDNSGQTYIQVGSTTNRWGFIYEIAGGPQAASLEGDGTVVALTGAGGGAPSTLVCTAVTAAEGDLVFGFYALTNDERAGGDHSWTPTAATLDYGMHDVDGTGPQLEGQHQTAATAGSYSPTTVLTETATPAWTTGPANVGAIALVVTSSGSCG